MKRLILCVLCISWLAISAIAATGVSSEFKVDLSGMGPWEMRTAAASETISYSSTWATNTLADAKAVVKVYPVKREKPKYIAIDLSGGTAATHYPIEYLDEIPGGSWSDEYKTSKLVLRYIPAGSFIMGGRNTDYPGAVNTNLHMVTLTKDFYMGVFEVTQRQWELVMGNRPSAFSNETCYATRPVEQVSYIDIRGGVKGITWPESKDVDDGSFMGLLRKKSRLTGFDLPTEAQWEYACRGGTTTALNSGKNCSHISNCVEVAEVSRYKFNSGWVNIEDASAIDYNIDTLQCTAMVGCYPQNVYGLYDMHGNVAELCLDIFAEPESGSIDPCGASTGTRRVYKGGSWKHAANQIVSGNRHKQDVRVDYIFHNVGFRLCLQGGEIPESTEGVELVNAAGEGTANWTPTKAGTYYLTHETQTNGVNGAEVLGAWFMVDAPKLAFVPDGDLTPGVKVAIAGAGDGWTVRYELSGNENGGVGTRCPTSESPEYTEPITLNESATIRAMAFSDGGLESHEYSATFSLMSVGGAVAKPRYPWNGKVDIDVTVKGAESEDYLVSLIARNLDGGTNLPLRTAWQTGGTITNNAFLVKPGAHRFTWDSAADITNDCEFANVAVNVSAAHNAIIAAKKVLTLEVAGYAGTETLTNVPVLVRLSTAIDGFSYADFVDAQGGDLIFTDESGSIVYPHEIDEWHIDGESLVWVKLPLMANGTKFKAGYGGGRGATALPNGDGRAASPLAAAVWSDYAGVWHMNEDSGTAYDSTAHGLDAQPDHGTNNLADVSQMVAYENGACGRARVNATTSLYGGNFLLVPSYDALEMGSVFVVVGWFKLDTESIYWPKLFMRGWSQFGWGVELRSDATSMNVLGSGTSELLNKIQVESCKDRWTCFCFVYDGNSAAVYQDGNVITNGTIVAAQDNGQPLSLGGNYFNSTDNVSFVGQYDEIRLRGGTLSADRIKADYDMIANRDFLRYWPVENGNGAAE